MNGHEPTDFEMDPLDDYDVFRQNCLILERHSRRWSADLALDGINDLIIVVKQCDEPSAFIDPRKVDRPHPLTVLVDPYAVVSQYDPR